MNVKRMKWHSACLMVLALVIWSCQETPQEKSGGSNEKSHKIKAVAKDNPDEFLLYRSDVVTEKTKGHAVDISVDVKNVRTFYLVVTNGGDNNHCDWANWVNPVVIGDGKKLDLTKMRWRRAESEFGKIAVNKNVRGKPLMVKGKKVNGIGTHAYSIIEYRIPRGYHTFKAQGALDDGGANQAGQSSVRFHVYTKPPKPMTSRRPGDMGDYKEVPLKNLGVPDDLEVTIWAQSPQFYNPTNMDIDAKGRIWVAEGMNYRRSRLRPEGDRIVVLEDTNGDGQCDKTHTFVQDKELVSPLGVSVIGNKVVVAQPPHLIVYTDVNNDAKFDPKLDKKEYLLSGFGGWNHDHSLHSVTVGPGGKWFFNIGNAGTGKIVDRSGKTTIISSWYDTSGSIPRFDFDGKPVNDKESRVKLLGKKSHDGHVYVGGAAFRMNPDGTNLEVIGHNFRNSYEQTVTSFGDVYQNDNDDPPNCRTTWLMEYGNLGFSSEDAKRSWRVDIRPNQRGRHGIAHWRQEDPGTIPAGDVYGGGAPTGICYYENGALGKKYQGLLLSCEAARNVVFGYLPKAQGAGFELKNFNFITSNPEKDFAGNDFAQADIGSRVITMFRPADVAVGPDGAIYVADWFDSRVGGHATYDKKGSGTIYRIAPKGFKPKVPEFDLSTVKGQVEGLKNPAVNVRALAFDAVVASGTKAIEPLKTLLKDYNPYIRARAVWALGKMGDEGMKVVEGLLSSTNDQTKVVAYRVIRREGRHMNVINKLSKDASAPLRREVALSLRDVEAKVAAEALVNIAKGYKKKDRWYLEAFGTGCHGKEDIIYKMVNRELGNKALKWSPTFADIAWRLHPVAAINDFVERANATSLSVDERYRMLTAIAFIDDEKAANAMVKLSKSATSVEVKKMAQWWLVHPNHESWREFKAVKALVVPVKITNDMLVPTTLGAKSTLPEDKKILELKGDAEKGKAIVGRCIMCHVVNKVGSDFGPDITAYGKTQTRDVILKALTNPSSDIAHGFEGKELLMKNGKKVQGFIMMRDKKITMVKVYGGQTITLASNDIQEITNVKKSFMISAADMGLTAQQVRDLVEYLKVGDKK